MSDIKYTPVSFWNEDMKVSEVLRASFIPYLNIASLKLFPKSTYQLLRGSDGTYKVDFSNGRDYIIFK